ncbi:glycosyltransferase [Sedimentimonas flavescens]|uniref:rhamnosyltransferase WsaF family glycosyltransferase n=1 Tax=Sedimentimonas flavescens TaxID=2851012 RepID=UPI001C4A1DBD|nr:glycosyltransferase [Sedimentimonas flavescens]MBW0158227.1 glycosyltransferase [Sedimentimonas flavescens]
MTPFIYITLAVFRPDPGYLEAQLQSVAAQEGVETHLVAVIADRVSGPMVARLCADLGLGLTLVSPDNNLDSVRAFEAGLARALTLSEEQNRPDALFALSDQDDIWHPDRLARGVAALGEGPAMLAHSDARLVDAQGAVIHPSMFAYERRDRRPGLRGLLYRNTITGMTVLMRRAVLEIALPFPAQAGIHFYHDLWLGLVAEAAGGVVLIDAPLVDYRQHGANTVGAVSREPWRLPRFDNVWLRRRATSYALARYLANSTYLRMAEAVASGRLADGSARIAPIRPYLRRLRGAGSFAADALRLTLRGQFTRARIASSFAVVHFGRAVWALRRTLDEGLDPALARFDERLYSLSPGVAPRAVEPAPAPTAHPLKSYRELIDLRKSARWTPVFEAPGPAIVVLVPTLNPTEIFAGIVTALDIAIGLAERGLTVRLVATDLPMAAPAASRAFVLNRMSAAGQASGAAERISLHCGVQSASLPLHRGDRFLATAWWTAHVADRLIRQHGFLHHRFHYLIQDYEPNFYAWGPEYADALASYGLNFAPIFNTTLLRDYFQQEGFAFAGRQALAFHPAIDIDRYSRGQRRAATGPRRLALYGRPEVPRNMFATGLEVIARFIEAENLQPGQIELVSVGLKHGNVNMPNGLRLISLGKLPYEDYPTFLLETGVGLSLMYSPHPSHPPIEMAASGVRVVTNSFGPKDLGRLSPAILSAAPEVPALSAALSRAWHSAPVSAQERQISLSGLGLSPEAMIDALAAELGAGLPQNERMVS